MCYSITTAFLLSYEMNLTISPLSILVNYNDSLLGGEIWRGLEGMITGTQQDIYEGGMLRTSLLEAANNDYHLCSNHQFRSFWSNHQLAQKGYNLSTTLGTLTLVPGYSPRLFLFKKLKQAIETAQQQGNSPAFKQKVDESLIAELFPSQNTNDVYKGLAQAAQELKSSSSMINDVLLKAISSPQNPLYCQAVSTRNIEAITRSKSIARGPLGVLRHIHDGLERGKPVGIMIDPLSLRKEGRTSIMKGVLGEHVVSVWARRFNRNSGSRGQCEYLIKDSFGPDCTQYAQSFDGLVRCVCEDGRDFDGSCQGKSELWVSDRILHDITASVTWIK